MARVIFINAILSGKLGGTVYAHNKAGPYVRRYVIPTNPNTIAQADARNEFLAATTAWHQLSDAQKAAWNTYGTSDFKAKNPVLGVLYSGFNAFVSLWNASKNAQRKHRSFTMKGDGINDLTFTEEDWLLSNTPPTGTFSTYIETSAGDPLGTTIGDIALFTNGTAIFRLHLINGVKGQTEAPLFIEPNTELPVGYILYASNVIGQPEHFVTKPNQTIIGSFRPPEITLGWIADNSTIDFTLDVPDASIPDHKLWYDAGDICRLEVWACGQTGPLIRIGEKIVTVTAPA